MPEKSSHIDRFIAGATGKLPLSDKNIVLRAKIYHIEKEISEWYVTTWDQSATLLDIINYYEQHFCQPGDTLDEINIYKPCGPEIENAEKTT